jgi:hypothetical protein
LFVLYLFTLLLLPAETKDLREFDLNLNDIEDSSNGFHCFLSESFIYNDESIVAVILHKQLLDPKDIMDTKQQLVLTLLECGTKILVEEPSVPHYFHTNVNEILAGVEHTEARRAIETAFVCKLNGILAYPERHMKKYVLNLPVGLKCKMGHMNPTTGRILVGSLNIAEQNINHEETGLEMFSTMATVTYAIALDTDDPKVVRKNPAVGSEGLDYFKRMSKKL